MSGSTTTPHCSVDLRLRARWAAEYFDVLPRGDRWCGERRGRCPRERPGDACRRRCWTADHQHRRLRRRRSPAGSTRRALALPCSPRCRARNACRHQPDDRPPGTSPRQPSPDARRAWARTGRTAGGTRGAHSRCRRPRCRGRAVRCIRGQPIAVTGLERRVATGNHFVDVALVGVLLAVAIGTFVAVGSIVATHEDHARDRGSARIHSSPVALPGPAGLFGGRVAAGWSQRSGRIVARTHVIGLSLAVALSTGALLWTTSARHLTSTPSRVRAGVGCRDHGGGGRRW